MIKTFEPPFLLNKEKSFIEDKIKAFSQNLFENKLYGYIIAILFNFYLISCLYKHKSFLTIILESLLFYIIFNTIVANLFTSNKK